MPNGPHPSQSDTGYTLENRQRAEDVEPVVTTLDFRKPSDVAAMGKVARALEGLDDESLNRVLIWIEYYYGRGKRRVDRADTDAAICELLAARGGQTPSQVSVQLGFPNGDQTCKLRMWRMAKAGVMVSERGRYWVRSAMP